MNVSRTHGIGFTSQRTRDRMVERLRAKGIRDEAVLAAMGAVPRHLFVDEALASRATRAAPPRAAAATTHLKELRIKARPPSTPPHCPPAPVP